MPGLVDLLLAGALGGLVADVVGRWIWTYLTRPKLKITGVAKSREVSRKDELEYETYQILVKNRGRTAAKNCKPEIAFSGTAQFDYMAGEAGEDIRQVDINTPVRWSEEGNPPRITINRGETAAFDLLRWEYQEGEGISFPTEQGWDSEPIVMQWEHLEEGSKRQLRKPEVLKGGKTYERIAPRGLREIEWDSREVLVTAENADKAEAFIEFDWADEELTLSISNPSGLLPNLAKQLFGM
ncbi:MAG: hypothetical protein ABEI86_09545 [Halobacteriaceae archaeon]